MTQSRYFYGKLVEELTANDNCGRQKILLCKIIRL